MSDLKPCPFCGGPAEIKAWANQYGQQGWAANCTRDECYARISYGDDCEREHVAGLWNERTEPPASQSGSPH
jgi:restriction alleviation protein Lar